MAAAVEEVIGGAETEYLLLYFGASWCPPCRRFLPSLLAAREDLRTRQRQKVEFLFVSLDEGVEKFREYHAKMSFPALPFEAEEAK